MDWLFDHLGIVIFIALAVLSMLSKLKKAAAQQQTRGVIEPARNAEPDAAERTRRIQEEIRRKIAERAGRVSAAPPPPALAGEKPAAEPPELPPRNIFEELARQMAQAKQLAENQARRRVQEEQAEREAAETRRLAEARRAQEEAQRMAATAAVYHPADAPAVPDRREKLLAALRQPQSLREALVLREILGAPPGL